jgi:AhpD family alkylhydroperoxidase
MAAGALGTEEGELIALSIGASKQCVGCIAFHIAA